jgi:hypothetical protein
MDWSCRRNVDEKADHISGGCDRHLAANQSDRNIGQGSTTKIQNLPHGPTASLLSRFEFRIDKAQPVLQRDPEGIVLRRDGKGTGTRRLKRASRACHI